MGKGRRMNSEKGGFELELVMSKANAIYLIIHATDPVISWISIVILSGSIWQLVGGVSVNSICQQDRLFAVSLNNIVEKKDEYSLKFQSV